MNIICDLDGTIALDTGRSIHLHQNEDCPKYAHPENHAGVCICGKEERNWKAYFDQCGTDEPCDAVIEILNSLASMHDIHILSGRSMGVCNKTIQWLADYEVPYKFLQMRSVDDRTDDHILKLRWAKEFGLTPTNTLFVLEDRQRVVDAWRAAGFRCFQVAPGGF